MEVKKEANSLRSWKLKRTLGCWRYQTCGKPIVLREAHYSLFNSLFNSPFNSLFNSLFNSPFNSPFIAYAAVD